MAAAPAPHIVISPSLLAADFSRLADEVRNVEDGGADWLHVDVMDGHFVPNLTMGPVVVEALRRCTKLPLDVHLMVEEPQRYVTPFLEAGAHLVTVHVEASGLRHEATVQRTLEQIRQGGGRAGISVRPRTTAEALRPFLPAVDLVLVMTVEPGFGGQVFMPNVVPKVKQLREWYRGDLSVDGGINAQTGRLCREAGANVLVAGTYVFRSPSCRDAIQSLRG